MYENRSAAKAMLAKTRAVEGSQIYPAPRKSHQAGRSDPSSRPLTASHGGAQDASRHSKKKAPVYVSFSHVSPRLPAMTFMPLGMMRASMQSPEDLLRKLMRDSDEEET